TGSRRSNPTGAWLALADLLDWCPDLQPLGLSRRIRAALEAAVADGPPTYDLAPARATDLSDMDQFNKRVLGGLE
ncbi:hypothetical protein ACIOEX_33445, partial [Streptomyces sp. NPDC087850]